MIIRTGLLLTLVFAATLALGQYNPHPKGITYSEDYRGQYHFSPKSEWMNDINALMYLDGKYHMIYQWGERIRHGGYATSSDLLHWTDEGVALIPQESFLPKDAVRNVSGAHVYSGSGVVVSGETAKKITGSPKEALVAIYTGTEVGTCLAWSNDGGKSWHDYKDNPVGNPTKGADPRDPCVFWHEPTKKWILAIYEKGTTFYGSPDLINWEFLSNIPFGYECPDVFELPLDGDTDNMKWVLQDANGTYLVGHFDGKEFEPEQDRFVMDVGPDFYAAQTFFRPNFPSKKLIQIAWNDHWNGGIGESPWQRNATFPVEVGLITFEGKMRITRSPIPAIRSLYENTKRWKNKTVHCSCKANKNILANVKSKKFDLTAIFDLNGATAREIEFKVANRAIRYNIEEQELLGKSLKPDAENKLSIRMLVDWGQLEIFAAGGVFSYSQQFAFTPDDDSLALYCNGGEVKLESLEVNEVARTWPAKDSPKPKTTDAGKNKVKVFLLAGQSNMEGHGHVRSLDHLGNHPTYGNLLARLKAADGSWDVRDDVTVAWQMESKPEKSGPLTVGWGCEAHEIGPELMFGTIMGDKYDEPVLLIKTAWGGKDVYCDFRSPSAGKPTGPVAAVLEQQAAEENRREVGRYYRKMVAEIKETLENLDRIMPGYKGQGYEIVGMAWFQGWNDFCQWHAHVDEKHVGPAFMAAYPRNLTAMFRDLRKELSVPDMPIVIGELGVGGHEMAQRAKNADDWEAVGMMAFRRAQKAAASYGGIKNVTFVPTAAYWDVRLQQLRKISDAYWNEKQEQGIQDTEDNHLPTKELNDEFLRLGHHWYCHYNGSATNYSLIGYALAEALNQLTQ